MTPTRQFFRSFAAAVAEIGSTVTVGLGPVTITLQPKPAAVEPAHGPCSETTCLRCGRVAVPPRRP